MQAFNHILAATDFSESSRRAVELATELARQVKASLTLVHVFQYPRALYSESALYSGDLVEPVLEEVEETMAQTVRSLSHDIPQASAKIRQGVPHEQILAAAKECGADLIVMGTHGRTGLARVMLGSVTERVVRLSPVPVLTVRQPEHEVATTDDDKPRETPRAASPQ
jgi:nucleotide-binding universal stress UspA family protein